MRTALVNVAMRRGFQTKRLSNNVSTRLLGVAAFSGKIM
jgi:hypothetical protein